MKSAVFGLIMALAVTIFAVMIQSHDIRTLDKAIAQKNAELTEIRSMADAALAKIDRMKTDEAWNSQTHVSTIERPAQIFEKAQFAVAITEIDETPGLLQSSPSAYASGIVTKINGHICVITARHVIANKAHSRYFAHFKPDGTGTTVNSEELTTVDSCPDHDLAVMRFTRPNFIFPWAPAEFAPSRELKMGDAVFAIGTQLRMPFVSSCGHILSTNANQLILPTMATERHARLIAHDAAINPGNSGGPLLDDQGRIIGMNMGAVNGSANTPRLVNIARVISLAVPSDIILHDAQTILSGQKIEHAEADAQFENSWEISPANTFGFTPKQCGVIVVRVVPGSDPAQKGLQAGDLVLRCDGLKPRDANEVLEAIMNKRGGDILHLTVRHEDGTEQDADMQLLAPLE